MFDPEFSWVNLEWFRNSESEGVDYYRVERSNEEGSFYVCGSASDPGSGTMVYDTDKSPNFLYDYHRYRVKAHNAQGFGPPSYEIEVWLDAGGPDSVEFEYVALPTELTLEQNHPNPFNPDTQIKFGLPAPSHVRLRVLNTRGETVRTIVDEDKPAGWFTITWDGKNEGGQQVASGIYLYLIETEEKRIIKRMTLIR